MTTKLFYYTKYNQYGLAPPQFINVRNPFLIHILRVLVLILILRAWFLIYKRSITMARNVGLPTRSGSTRTDTKIEKM